MVYLDAIKGQLILYRCIRTSRYTIFYTNTTPGNDIDVKRLKLRKKDAFDGHISKQNILQMENLI